MDMKSASQRLLPRQQAFPEILSGAKRCVSRVLLQRVWFRRHTAGGARQKDKGERARG